MKRLARSSHEEHDVGINIPTVLERAGVVGIWEYRIDEGCIYTDHAMAEFYGVDPNTASAGVSPSKFRQSIHPDDLSSTVASFRYAIATGTDYKARYRVVGDDGVARFVEARAKPYLESGRVVSLAGVNIQVSDEIVSSADLLNRLAEISVEVAGLAAEFGDVETTYFAEMLVTHIGQKLGARIMSNPEGHC